MTTALDVLKKARARISKPEAWTKGVEARDSDGMEVECKDERAACWCSIGALYSVADNVAGSGAYTALCDAIGDDHHIADWNDRSTHAEVLAGFDRAIARLESAVPGNGRKA